MVYSVHHGITKSRYGELMLTEKEAVAYAKRLSKSLRHTVEIQREGKVIKFALAGVVYDEVKSTFAASGNL